jgi:hypothetical protein
VKDLSTDRAPFLRSSNHRHRTRIKKEFERILRGDRFTPLKPGNGITAERGRKSDVQLPGTGAYFDPKS